MTKSEEIAAAIQAMDAFREKSAIMADDDLVLCAVGHALNDHDFNDTELNNKIGKHILFNLKDACLLRHQAASRPLDAETGSGGERTVPAGPSSLNEGPEPRWQSTILMRARASDLASPPRDDFDRAVQAVLSDLLALSVFVRTPFASTLTHEEALERLRAINRASYMGE